MEAPRVVVVMGGGQGIGCAIAQRFANAGYRVVVADIVQENAEYVATAIGGAGYVVDICDELSVGGLLDAVIASETRIDVLVNAAGIFRFGSNLLDTGLFEWEEVLRVNLTGTFICAREAARRMKAHSGASIVNISSGSALLANENAVAYSSSKAGVAHFTRCAAMDLAGIGIRVNAVSPGPTASPMTMTAHSAERRAEISARVPLARFARAEEIAGAVLFLASEEASFITGEVIVVDGGVSVAGRLARGVSAQQEERAATATGAG